MDFQELVEQAKSIEKSAEPKKPYSEDVELPKTLDFSPEEFVEKGYQDVLNEYERRVKVAKVGGARFAQVMGRLEVAGKPESKVAETERVEQPKPAKPAPAEKKPAVVVVKKPAEKAAVSVPPKPKEAEKPPEIPKAEVQPFEPVFKPELPEEAEAKAAEAPSELMAEKREARPEKKEEKKTELSSRIMGLMLPFSKQGEEKPETVPAEEGKKIALLPPPPPPAAEPPKKAEAPKAAPRPPELEFEFERAKPAPPKAEEKGEEKPAEKVEPVPAKPEIPAHVPPRPPEEREEPKAALPAPQPVPEEKKPAEISQTAKEAIGEASVIPYLEHHEPVSLPVPPLLSSSPEQAAESKYAELEASVPTSFERAGEAETKKRMIELTKELFKEKSTAQRQKIKAEIASLREMLSKKSELPKTRSVSYATSFFNSMEVAQKMELAEAKESMMRHYRDQLSKMMGAFSSSLRIAKRDEDRKAIYETFVADADALRVQVEALSDRYEDFFLREHTLSLQKLRSLASLKNDKYVMEKAEERLKEIKFTYAAEFLGVEDSARKELATLVKAKKHEALESRMSSEMEKVLSIVNMAEEELLKYANAHLARKYSEFEARKISKLELLQAARTSLAEEAGLKKEIINKYFG